MTYRSHADLGGSASAAPVVPEPVGELFHADWEPRVLALTVAMGSAGLWNIDQSRAARETLEHYAQSSYYEIWFGGLEKLLTDRDVLGPTPNSPESAAAPPCAVPAATVAAALARGTSYARTAATPARYALGQAVRTVARGPDHHTRLPGYARGKSGVITRVHGAHVFPDTNSRGLGEDPQWLYTVTFTSQALWGDAARESGEISIDAWEPYLEPQAMPT